MKKIVTTFLCSLFVVIAEAQKLSEGSMASLVGEEYVSFYIDYSKGSIDSYPDSVYSKLHPTWEETKDRLNLVYVSKSNNECERITLVDKNDERAHLIFVMVIDKIDNDGETDASIYLYEKDELGKPLAKINQNMDGGKFASLEQLAVECFTEGGEDFGDFIDRIIMRINNNKKEKGGLTGGQTTAIAIGASAITLFLVGVLF